MRGIRELGLISAWRPSKSTFPRHSVVSLSHGGERVRVRGFEPIERAMPPHPTPLPNGEREPTTDAARLAAYA